VTESDSITWRSHARVEKWTADQTRLVEKRITPGQRITAGDFARYGIDPEETAESAGNLLVTAGLGRLTSLLTGAGGQAVTNTSARLGVGDGAGTAAVGDTDLSASAGATHRYYQVMDATYPTTSDGVVTFKATFDTSTANFAWSEWGIDVGTPTVTGGTTVAALLLNHKTSAALGTKTTGTWVLTATITVS
jgi:hypothetical protein